MANVMAVFQDVDKCMRCNGCVIACKRTWKLAEPATLPLPAGGTPAQTVKARQRLAIKSQRRSDMGAFMRFSCWHCPSPPCVPACPQNAMKKEANGAVSVDKTLCDPELCRDSYGRYPCEVNCQRGGYPKIGRVYAADAADKKRMNKCTLCFGRAGLSTAADALQTRATQPEIDAVPEKAHEPACVSSCPAKAMKWDTRDTILAMLQSDYKLNGVNNWLGDGSMFWGSKKVLLAPPKADPFIEDHVAPTAQSLGMKLVLPTLVIGGLAALSTRRTRIASGEEV